MPLGKAVGLGPGHTVLDSEPVGTQRPPQQPLPTFRPMSIVAKRSPISAIAELFCLVAHTVACVYKLGSIASHHIVLYVSRRALRLTFCMSSVYPVIPEPDLLCANGLVAKRCGSWRDRLHPG